MTLNADLHLHDYDDIATMVIEHTSDRKSLNLGSVQVYVNRETARLIAKAFNDLFVDERVELVPEYDDSYWDELYDDDTDLDTGD